MKYMELCTLSFSTNALMDLSRSGYHDPMRNEMRLGAICYLVVAKHMYPKDFFSLWYEKEQFS